MCWLTPSSGPGFMHRTGTTSPSPTRGISAMRSDPSRSTRTCPAFWLGCTTGGSADTIVGGHRSGVTDLGQLARNLVGGEHETGVAVVNGRAEHHAQHLAVEIDQRATRIAL